MPGTDRPASRPLGAWMILGLVAVLLAGCGSVPLDYQAPGGFDLSGAWVLDASQSEAPERSGRSFRSGFMTQDFPLLVSREMRIEQDAGSMGIDFTKGTYRDVTWGERRRGIWEVRAGWREGALYIFSEAPDSSATEVWRLSEDGQRLFIRIEVKDQRTRAFERTFVRSSEI